ncbi:MAG: hypothetical protein A2Z28_05050 [Chloroflexi bacterium RBG_16_51_9]|nr:MAG: hypothetical protein A2Z28_05050 [Chloroflexi bacterium RBG_16_51_9]
MPVTKPVIYTVASCPASLKLKEDWRSQGLDFEERPVDNSQKWLDEAVKYGDMVPIIVFGDGKIQVGYQGMIG